MLAVFMDRLSFRWKCPVTKRTDGIRLVMFSLFNVFQEVNDTTCILSNTLQGRSRASGAPAGHQVQSHAYGCSPGACIHHAYVWYSLDSCSRTCLPEVAISYAPRWSASCWGPGLGGVATDWRSDGTCPRSLHAHAVVIHGWYSVISSCLGRWCGIPCHQHLCRRCKPPCASGALMGCSDVLGAVSEYPDGASTH